MTTAMEELVVTVTPRNRANFRRLKTNSIQSVKRWEKENELLYAMMEDESEWLAKLFPDVVISPEFFFYALEDGSLLCRLANYIQEKAELYSQKHNVPVPGKKFRFHTMSKCGREIKLFRSRENVQQFLIWCRSHGLPEAILFESNDVVQVDDYREGCRGVIICLMEIVRRTAKFDLDELPQLIQMEKEIEEDEAHSDTELSNDQGQVLDVEKINNMTEIDNLEVHADQPEIQSPSSLDSDSGVDSVFDQDEGDNTASRLTEFSHEETEKTEKTKTRTVTVRKQTSSPKPKDHKGSPKKGKELPSLLESTGPKSELDKQVCKIAQDYNIKIVHRLKEGKYIILGRVMFVRMLNDHMLVRIGGGWDTLEHYLMTHAPSKEALEAPSTPSSQAVTSPRNSISAASGVRTNLFERVKRKEQVGIVNRDSAVYSSQGSLNQQLGAASSPKIRDKGKRESLKDEKDITDAIRKISTSVSQTLAERPVSFTNKSFHQLKSRFDKGGIFGAARRTSSPDLTLKGDKIRRRLSDTPRMADVETTLAFDGEQVPVANNNDTESKQPENVEEQGVGKLVAPTGDLLGDASLQTDISTPEDVVSDETDSGVPVGDLLSMETSNQSHLNGDSWDGQVNGGANFVDVSSFDPFAAAPQQSELLSTSDEALDEQEEQPMSTTVVDNGALAHEEQSSEAASETTPESSPRVELGDLLRDAEPDSTLDASPRPVDLGDLLLDSETTTEQEKIDLSPEVTLEEEVPLVETVPESQTTEVEEARSGEPVSDEDVSSNIQEVPSVVVGPTPETLVESESESLKVDEQYGGVGHVRDDEPVMGENMPVSVSDVPPFVVDPKEETLIETEVEPPKPDEEFIELEQDGPDEPVMNVDIPERVQEDNPPLAVADSTPETPVETTEVETPKPEEASTPIEKTVEEQPSGEKEPSSHEESVLETQPELPNVDEEFGKIEETTHSEEPVVEKASELHEIEGKPVNLEEPAKEEEPTNVEKPFSGEEAVIKSEGESTEAGPEVDATRTQEGTGALASDVQVAEREPLKADEGKEDDKPVETEKVEKASDKGAKSKPAAAIPKSPPKAGPVAKQTSAKKPTGAAKPTSPIKAPISAPAKKDLKASVPRAPASKPAASKAPASMGASAKKPAAKPATTKVDEQKKPEKPKSAAATRPSSKTSESKTQGATRPTSSSTTAKKPLYSTTAPSAAKAPSKGVKDAGPTKSTSKTTTTKPPSAKPAATKTVSSATKPAAAKPSRTQSAKPVDSTDSAALAKKPMARPQSAKSKVTTTTTTVKKTTTTTTTKVGAGPVKSQTSTTKTVTQSKGGQPKSSTTTSTTTKTTAKPGTRPSSAAVKKAGTTGAKSKTGGQPGTGAAGGKSATKCAPKKKAEKPAEEKEMKQEEKTPEPTTAVDEKPTEVVETSSEVVETVVKPPGEASPEDKSNELTPDSTPVDQTTPEVEEASEEIVEQFSVVRHVVTAETTTVIKDGEEQSTTTTEETTFEQSAES